MPLDVAIYAIAGHRRSTVCTQAMYSGIKAVGDRPRLLVEADYREPLHDIAVFYGYTATLQRVMADYIAAGRKAVYIDLGYWHREGLHGHHKISLNGRHPTAYFQKRPHRFDRAAKAGVTIEPWRATGRHILLAGMGEKAANAEGLPVEKWERDAVAWLSRISDRPITYRPKPSWLQAREIPGTRFSWGGTVPRLGYHREFLHDVLRDCHAIVTHHSNVAVEAICAGVPAFAWKGVAVPMASQDIDAIETPAMPEGREQWAADIAYTQWNVAEMQAGLPWRNFKDEGLIS